MRHDGTEGTAKTEDLITSIATYGVSSFTDHRSGIK
jgi:hypothetical protein